MELYVFPIDRRNARRREGWIAVRFGLPWGWRVRQVGQRLIGSGEALACGHKTISTIIKDGDVLEAAGRFAYAVAFHKSEAASWLSGRERER